MKYFWKTSIKYDEKKLRPYYKSDKRYNRKTMKQKKKEYVKRQNTDHTCQMHKEDRLRREKKWNTRTCHFYDDDNESNSDSEDSVWSDDELGNMIWDELMKR